ncbi:hypothetical protein, partial [Kitasatospora putterlickiae]|uniref:hypothetical protein n=1 Tax=Kitasatospora putterlickiae TaxID=221725 RepID=UPI0031D849BC
DTPYERAHRAALRRLRADAADPDTCLTKAAGHPLPLPGRGHGGQRPPTVRALTVRRAGLAAIRHWPLPAALDACSAVGGAD